MSRPEWFEKLLEMDSRQYEDILHYLSVKPECGKCGYFNQLCRQTYKCRIAGRCIAATLNEDLQERMRKHLGWVN